jgi:hypothetical protein
MTEHRPEPNASQPAGEPGRPAVGGGHPGGGRPGRGTRKRDPADPCLNCGDDTYGEYCASCGQRKVDVRVSIRTMAAEALEDELLIGRRLPTTLKALLLKPGQLTVDYVNGRIARHVSPLKLYLVSSIIFFLLLSVASLRLVREMVGETGPPPPPAATQPDLPVDTPTLAELDSTLTAVREALEDPDLPTEARDQLRTHRNELVRQRAVVASREGRPPPAVAADTVDGPVPGPAGREDEDASDRPSFRIGHPALDSLATARVRELSELEFNDAAARVIGDLVGYIPTIMFVLLPLFALVLKLLYVRRRRYYAEHFIFLLHTHAFLYMLFTILLLAVMSGWMGGWLMLGMLTWIAVYVFLAMRRVYGQSRIKTFLKMWALGSAYFLILLAALPVAVLITILLL